MALALPAAAQNATWNLNGTGEYNSQNNWTPNTVPSGTAYFGRSNQVNVSISGPPAPIGGWTFNPGASNYIFTNAGILSFGGAGIAINGGSAVINNAGILGFFNSSSAGSVTITNDVNLEFYNGSTAGNAIINNLNALTFIDTSSARNATITNNYTLGFFGSSTAGSATIINNGNLSFWESSTAGSSTITNNTGGTINFTSSTSSSATIINYGFLEFTSSGGAGRLINGAAGAIDVSTSDLITVGSIEGGGTIYLGMNNLTVGANNLSTTFSGVIFDCGPNGINCAPVLDPVGGSLVKVGTGTLTLSGINTYVGATTVNGGTLEVDGSIASSSGVTVVSGATLSGTGVVGSAVIGSSGTLSPGNAANPTGTLTMTGSLAFQAGAVYLVGLNPTTASLASVGDMASLAGAVQGVLTPGSYSSRTTYNILHAASISGTFTEFSAPGFGGTLTYTPTDVLLNLTANLGRGGGLNPSQQNVANSINSFFNNGGTLPAGFLPIFSLSGGNLGTTLSELSGEVGTGAGKGASELMTQFLDLMLDPTLDGRGGTGGAMGFAPEQEASVPEEVTLAYARVLKKAPDMVLKAAPPATLRWSVWGAAFGGSNQTSGDPTISTNNVTARDFGFAAGADYRYSPDTVLGFALAGGGTNWGLAQGLGSGRSDAFQAGVYGITHWGAAYLASDAAFADHAFATNRTAALGDQLSASFNGQSFGARLEAGYRYGTFGTTPIGLTPYAALQVQSFHTPSYAETDLTGGGFGLTYNAMNATDTRSELGARVDDLTALSGLPLILRGRLAWAHDWVSNPALGAVFQALPGASFTVNGAAPPKDSALTTASAEFKLRPNWSLTGKFDGEFARSSQTYAGSGTVRWSW